MGLFYFSGHGVQYHGDNYLIPIGAMRFVNVAEQLLHETLNSGYVLDTMKAANNELNIVILDACRDNPIKSTYKGKKMPNGLVKSKAPSGFLIAYATAEGEVAKDGKGRNSPYVIHLMSEMQKPNVMIEQMLKQVRIAVIKQTNDFQKPDYQAAIDIDFYFNSKVIQNSEPVTPSPSPSIFERLIQSIVNLWQVILVVVIPISLIWLRDSIFKSSQRLSILNPIDYIRVLWWALVMPQKFISYQEQFDKNQKRVGYWLASTLTWLPLLIPSLALGFQWIPHATISSLTFGWISNSNYELSPEIYLRISAGVTGCWLLMGLLGNLATKWINLLENVGLLVVAVLLLVVGYMVVHSVDTSLMLVVVFIIPYIVRFIVLLAKSLSVLLIFPIPVIVILGVADGVLKGVTSDVMFVVAFMITLIISKSLIERLMENFVSSVANVVMDIAVRLIVTVAMTILVLDILELTEYFKSITMIVMFSLIGVHQIIIIIWYFIVNFVMDYINNIMEDSVTNSFDTGKPSWLARFAFLLLICSYLYLIYYCFFKLL